MKYYVDSKGDYLGAWDIDGPVDGIPVEPPPESADQVWLFPGWGESPSRAAERELAWQTAELIAIAAQLDALEEAEAGEPPTDLEPGTRTEWLRYRGQVRNWKAGAEHYPDSSHRPIRPT